MNSDLEAIYSAMSLTTSISNGSIAGHDDLIQLDPNEFDLPEGQTQTLEEILKEEAPHLLFDDDFDFIGLESEDAIGSDRPESSFAASAITNHVSRNARDWRTPVRRHPKSELLRLTRFRVISSQLNFASDRASIGTPSALAVHCQDDHLQSNMHILAVGTTRGRVLVFDVAQESLRFCTSVCPFGAVSSMSLSKTGTRLLIGFNKGQVQLINAKDGEILANLSSEQTHQVGRGVLHSVFLDQSRNAVVVDTGGSVFHLRFGMGTVPKLHCIFSGCHGEVCSIQPLRCPKLPLSKAAHSAHYSNAVLLAMATVTKVLVLRLKPPASIVSAFALNGPAACPPLIAWHWVPILVTPTLRTIDPVLAYCRGPIVHFHQLHTSDGSVFRCFPVQTIVLPTWPIQLQWLNARCLLVLDIRETFHLYDVGSGSQGGSLLSTVDGVDVKLVYMSGDFKGLATGGNVSQAFRCMANNACYQSMTSTDDGRVYVLGMSGVFVVVARSWLERIESLRADGNLPDAMQLGVDFVTGRQKIGCQVAGGKWREIVAGKVAHLLLDYVEGTLGTDCPSSGKVDQLLDHFRLAIPICVENCIAINDFSLLYNEMYTRFSRDPLARGLFLECLEDKLLDEKLPNVPPVIIQDYLNHLAQEGLFSSLESSIVRLPIDKLDLHQVMTLCRTHSLYDGIIYVHNKALNDYLTPLEEMLVKLHEAVARHWEMLTDEEIQLGNRILLYLNCCLNGRAYPIGILDSHHANKVANDVLECLISEETIDNDQTSDFPNVKLLLKFDAREFLNVLSMSSQSPIFANDRGNARLQHFVNILLQIVLTGPQILTTELGAFLTFIARLTVQVDHLTVGTDKFHQWPENTRITRIQLLETVLSADNQAVGTSVFEERQQAVLELLRNDCRNFDLDLVLHWAERGKYWQVCEHLYWQRRDFDRVLVCYLEEPFLKSAVFTLISNMLHSNDILQSEKFVLKRRVQKEIPLLATIDIKETAKLLLNEFVTVLNVIFDNFPIFQSSELCRLLSVIFYLRKDVGHGTVTCDEKLDRLLAEKYVALLIEGENSRVDRDLLDFVHNWGNLCDDNDTILKMCLQKDILVASTVFLLERRARFEPAFRLLFTALDRSLDSENWTDFVDFARQTLSFSRRCFSKLPEKALHSHWFSLFKRILRLPNEKLKTSTEVKELLTQVVHSMVQSVVAPAEVLTQLFGHSAFKSCVYSEHRQLIGNILSDYEYNQILLSSVVSSIEHDAHSLLSSFRNALNYPISRVKIQPCLVCQSSQSRNCVVFSCGHIVHVQCMNCAPDSIGWKCPCNNADNKSISGTGRKSAISSEPNVSTDSLSSILRHSFTLNIDGDEAQTSCSIFDPDSFCLKPAPPETTPDW